MKTTMKKSNLDDLEIMNTDTVVIEDNLRREIAHHLLTRQRTFLDKFFKGQVDKKVEEWHCNIVDQHGQHSYDIAKIMNEFHSKALTEMTNNYLLSGSLNTRGEHSKKYLEGLNNIKSLVAEIRIETFSTYNEAITHASKMDDFSRELFKEQIKEDLTIVSEGYTQILEYYKEVQQLLQHYE